MWCVLILDVGVMKGDGAGTTAVCYYFARGCCTSGEACEYLYWLFMVFDDVKNYMMFDIFGWLKYYMEWDDNGGMGLYMRVGRTLYMFFGGVVDLKWGAKKVYDEVMV